MPIQSSAETASRPNVGLLGWYAVCTTEYLTKDAIYYFSMFNEPLVIFRDQNYKPKCVKDFCRHRGASFRGGDIKNGEIICPYHGARFTSSSVNGDNETITCTHIVDKAYKNFAKHVNLFQYPCIEKGDYIYIYYSGKAQTRLEDVKINTPVDHIQPEAYGFKLEEKEYEQAFIDFKCDWSRIIENHLDILHIFWMHGNSLPGNEVNRKTIKSFNQTVHKDSMHLRSVYTEKDGSKDEFISQIFIPPGRVVIFKGATDKARYIQVLDHIPLSNNRARIIVRHYRAFMKNKLLCKLIMFKQRQLRTFYSIFSEDYLVLQTQTFNEQMGYMKQENIKLLSEDKMIKIFLDWHQNSLETDNPWDLHPTNSNTNKIHQDLLMEYPPANPHHANKIRQFFKYSVTYPMLSLLIIFVTIISLRYGPELISKTLENNILPTIELRN
ncbi:MAG: Rieske 2Fe-2S domain-containing protein [Prochlorococcus sp.]